LVSGSMVLALNGCGGGSGSGDNGGGDNGGGDIQPPQAVTLLNILDLDMGYVIEGTSSYGNDVVLSYCKGKYDYERIPGSHYRGGFNITYNDTTISMLDNDGGSYRIDTGTGYLEVGEYYDIYDVADDITITNIYEDINC